MMVSETEKSMNEDRAAADYVCLPQAIMTDGCFSVRSVRPSDIEDIRVWRNAQRDALRQKGAITSKQQVAYFAENVWPEMQNRQPANILLSYFRRGELIGYGGLVHIAWEHLRSELSFLLDPSVAADPQQYQISFRTFLAMMQVLAFRDLGFMRLFTETYATRTLHISVLESAGFEQEGVLREHVRINGRPVNSILHGCLSSASRG